MMKLQEMREKSIDELTSAIIDYKKELFNFKLQKSLNKLENVAQIKKTKNIIARIKTVIGEKKLAQASEVSENA